MYAVWWCSKYMRWIMHLWPVDLKESVSSQGRVIASFSCQYKQRNRNPGWVLQSSLDPSHNPGWRGFFWVLGGAGSRLGRGGWKGAVERPSDGHPFSGSLGCAWMQRNWLKEKGVKKRTASCQGWALPQQRPASVPPRPPTACSSAEVGTPVWEA